MDASIERRKKLVNTIIYGIHSGKDRGDYLPIETNRDEI
jgi:hypothetical protein